MTCVLEKRIRCRQSGTSGRNYRLRHSCLIRGDPTPCSKRFVEYSGVFRLCIRLLTVLTLKSVAVFLLPPRAATMTIYVHKHITAHPNKHSDCESDWHATLYHRGRMGKTLGMMCQSPCKSSACVFITSVVVCEVGCCCVVWTRVFWCCWHGLGEKRNGFVWYRC